MSEPGGDLDGQMPKGFFSTLMADGEWLFMKGEYKKAIESFTKVSQPLKYTRHLNRNLYKYVWLMYAPRLGSDYKA